MKLNSLRIRRLFAWLHIVGNAIHVLFGAMLLGNGRHFFSEFLISADIRFGYRHHEAVDVFV